MKIGNKEIGIGSGIAFILLLFILQGTEGALTAMVTIILFILPVFFILNNFRLDYFEKIIFSFLISIAIYPSIVYYLAFAIGSIRIATIILFLLLIAIAFIIKKLKYNNIKT